MPFTETEFPGLKVFSPTVFEDDRGYFFESYNLKTFEEADICNDFVQDNISKSAYGVLRGLHYQIEPFAQAKLVRVLQGEVLDVVVDIRKGSPTYGKTFKILLSANERNQLFIPKGFAHGFVVLSETAEFFYKCDNYYSKSHEAGIIFNDTELAIDWQIDPDKAILSNKDMILPSFADTKNNFEFPL